jgi:predicted nucleic acid-binding protein
MQGSAPLVRQILRYAEFVSLDSGTQIEIRDPKDQYLLTMAQTGRADMLVSRDEDLIAVSEHPALRPTLVLRPEEFLDALRSG